MHTFQNRGDPKWLPKTEERTSLKNEPLNSFSEYFYRQGLQKAQGWALNVRGGEKSNLNLALNSRTKVKNQCQ